MKGIRKIRKIRYFALSAGIIFSLAGCSVNNKDEKETNVVNEEIAVGSNLNAKQSGTSTEKNSVNVKKQQNNSAQKNDKKKISSQVLDKQQDVKQKTEENKSQDTNGETEENKLQDMNRETEKSQGALSDIPEKNEDAVRKEENEMEIIPDK